MSNDCKDERKTNVKRKHAKNATAVVLRSCIFRPFDIKRCAVTEINGGSRRWFVCLAYRVKADFLPSNGEKKNDIPGANSIIVCPP